MTKKEFSYSTLLMLFSIILGLILIETSLRFANLGYGNSPIESDPIFYHVHPKSYNFLSHIPSGEYGDHQVSYDQYGLVEDPDEDATDAPQPVTGISTDTEETRFVRAPEQGTEIRDGLVLIQFPLLLSAFMGKLNSTRTNLIQNF